MKKWIWALVGLAFLSVSTGAWFYFQAKVPQVFRSQNYATGVASITKISPQGNLDDLYQTIVVLYSKPMVALSSLETKDKLPCPLAISPKTAGTCKRISSRALEFTPETHWQGSTKYQVKTIDAKGLLSKVASGAATEFTTTALFASTSQYIDPKAGIDIVMNFPVALESFQTKLQLTQNGKAQTLKVQSTDTNSTHFHIDLDKGNLQYNQQYTLQIKAGLMPKYGNVPMPEQIYTITTKTFVDQIRAFQQVQDASGNADSINWTRRQSYDAPTNTWIIPHKGMEFQIFFSEDISLTKDLVQLQTEKWSAPKYKLSYLLNDDKSESKSGVKLTLLENFKQGGRYALVVAKSANKYMAQDEVKSLIIPEAFKVTQLLPKAYNMACLYTNNPLDQDSLVSEAAIKKAIQVSPSARIASVSPMYNGSDNCAPAKAGEFGYELNVRLNPHTTYSITATKNLKDTYGNLLTQEVSAKITTKEIDAFDQYLYSSLNRITNVILANQSIVANIQTINLDAVDLEVCQMSADQYISYLQTQIISADVCSEYRKGSYPVTNHYRTLTPNKIDLAKDVFKKDITQPVVIVKAKKPSYNPKTSEDPYGRTMQQEYLRESASIVMEDAADKTIFFVTSIDGKEILKDMNLSLYTREGNGYKLLDKSPIFNSQKQAYEVAVDKPIDLVVANDETHRAIVKSNDQANNYDFNYIGGYSMADKEFLYFYTDRPIYKPGDTVYYKGIGRTFTPQWYKPMSGKITLKMLDQTNSEPIKTRDIKTDKNGNLNGNFTLPKDLKLGMYTFQSDWIVLVNMPIDVQEYKKPLFKTTFDLDKSAYQMGDTINATVGANYYFGGKITHAPAKYDIQSQYYFFDAKDYSDYQFGAGYDYFSCIYRGECQNGDQGLGEQQFSLDGEGKGTIKYAIDPTETGHEYLYTFNLNITDPQTMTVVGKPSAVVVHQTDGYVGLKMPYRSTLKDGLNIAGITLDRDAKPKANAEVELQIIKQDRQAVKKQSVNGIFFTDYENKEILIDSFTVKSDNQGRIQKHISLKDGGQYRIVTSYRGANKRTFISSQDIYVDNNSYMMRTNDNNSVTDMMAESMMRKVGETQVFTVQSPVNQGKMLVTIEKDDGILDYRVQDISSYSPKVIVPIKSDYYPNIYTKVFLLGQWSGALPIYKRALGQTKVDTSYKKLNVDISTDKQVYKPGQKITITAKITDAQGKPRANTNTSISVVDESVLALKGNPKKNPYTFFFDMKRYLGVETYLSLRNLIEKLEVKDPTDGSKGGDGELNKGWKSKKKRGIFKDTAFWQADAVSDANGIVRIITAALPDNLTTWNIEVLVNTSPETEVGVAQTTVMTNKSLMIQENLPQFLGAGDTITLNPLIVNKMAKDAKIDVTLQASHTQIKTAKQTISLASGASVTVPFQLTVDQLLDLQKSSSKITITAKDVDSSIDDAVERYLPIQPTSTLETTTTIGRWAAKPDKEIIDLDGIQDYPGQLTLSYSPTLMGNVLQGLDFLQNYPYGCLEQRTSAISPVVLIKNLSTKLHEDYNLKKLKTQRRIDSYQGYEDVSRDQIIQEYIASLASFQNRDGGMVYWSDRKDKDPSNLWVSSYLLSALTDLQDIGYKASSSLVSDLRAYLQAERYRNKPPYCEWIGCSYDIATRIAVIDALARQSLTDYSPYKMRTLLQDQAAKDLKNPDLYFPEAIMLAHLAQNKNLSAGERESLLSAAKKLLQKVQNDNLVMNPREAYIGKWANIYTRIDQTSQMLQAIFLLDPAYASGQEQTTDLMLKWLIGQKKQGGFGSTTTTLSVVKWLIAYLGYAPLPTGNRVASTILNDSVIQKETIKPADKFRTYTKVFPFAKLDTKTSFALQVDKGAMFYDLTLSYYLPSDKIQSRDEGFSVQRTYYDYQAYMNIQNLQNEERKKYAKGDISYDQLKYPNRTVSYLTPVTAFKVGQLLVVYNEIVATETRDQVMFEGFLPAGTEAVNTSLATSQTLNIQTSSMQDQGSAYGYGAQQSSPSSTIEPSLEAKLNPIGKNGLNQINTDGDLFERVEFRMDRVMAYTNILHPGVHHFMYVVRAGYAGQFSINPTTMSQIYTPEVFGRTAGATMKIE